MNKQVLLIAFHFPPVVGSSGVHRGHSLAKYLPELGWDPIVLTANTLAHPSVSRSQTSILSPDLKIYRSFALDAARHMSIAGAYPSFFAWPDRWVSWYPSAVIRALRIVRAHKPQIIWSTYPIVTSQLIALTVARLTGLPWVSDFRDSMTDHSYPPQGINRKIIQLIERKVVYNANRVVFTAPGTQEMYAKRFSDLPKAHWQLILNGYDEDSFERAELVDYERAENKIVILHSGAIYPSERDPTDLFHAIASLKSRNLISAASCEIRLRATGHDPVFEPELRRLDISDIVKLLPSIGYEEALAEMMNVDGLLLLQAQSCNHQIPAKVYEYVRAKRPVIALTDEGGDTARLLAKLGGATFAPLNSENEIASALLRFLGKLQSGVADLDSDIVASYSRRAQAQRTAALLDDILMES